MRGCGPLDERRQGAARPDLDARERPPGSGRGQGAPTLAGQAGSPLGRAALAWWARALRPPGGGPQRIVPATKRAPRATRLPTVPAHTAETVPGRTYAMQVPAV